MSEFLNSSVSRLQFHKRWTPRVCDQSYPVQGEVWQSGDASTLGKVITSAHGRVNTSPSFPDRLFINLFPLAQSTMALFSLPGFLKSYYNSENRVSDGKSYDVRDLRLPPSNFYYKEQTIHVGINLSFGHMLRWW